MFTSTLLALMFSLPAQAIDRADFNRQDRERIAGERDHWDFERHDRHDRDREAEARAQEERARQEREAAERAERERQAREAAERARREQQAREAEAEAQRRAQERLDELAREAEALHEAGAADENPAHREAQERLDRAVREAQAEGPEIDLADFNRQDRERMAGEREGWDLERPAPHDRDRETVAHTEDHAEGPSIEEKAVDKGIKAVTKKAVQFLAGKLGGGVVDALWPSDSIGTEPAIEDPSSRAWKERRLGEVNERLQEPGLGDEEQRTLQKERAELVDRLLGPRSLCAPPRVLHGSGR